MTHDGMQVTDAVLDELVDRGDVGDKVRRPGAARRSFRALTGQELFVYDRELLYVNVDTYVAQHELVPTPLSPLAPVPSVARPPTPRALDALVAYAASAGSRVDDSYERVCELCTQVDGMHRGTSVALANLEAHAAGIRDALVTFDELTSGAVNHMESLLDRHALDLHVLQQVPISAKLLSGGGGGGSSARPAPARRRTLGDYVSAAKMHTVANVCERELRALLERHAQARETEAQLARDLGELCAEIRPFHAEPTHATRKDVAAAAERARAARTLLEQRCRPDENGWPVADKLDASALDALDDAVHELTEAEQVVREGVACVMADRNEIMARNLNLVQDMSSLQSDFAALGEALAELDADFGPAKLDGFKHLERLKKMLWAYGASVIEAVRRREYARFFIGKAQSLAELVAHVSEEEQERRRRFYQDVAAQLPWEVVGLDGVLPSLDITASRRSGSESDDAAFDRTDIAAFFSMLDSVEQELVRAGALHDVNPIAEARDALASTLREMDDAEDRFGESVRRVLLPGGDSETGSDVGDDAQQGRAPVSPCSPMFAGEPENEARAHVHELEEQLAAARAEAAAERARADAAEHSAAAAEADASAARAADEEARSRLDALLTRGDSASAELATAQARIGELHEALAAAQRSSQDHADEAAELRSALARLEEELRTARSRTEQLQAQLRAAEQAHAEAARQLEDRGRSKQGGAQRARELEELCRPLLLAAERLWRRVDEMPGKDGDASTDASAEREPHAPPADAGLPVGEALLEALGAFDSAAFYHHVHAKLEALTTLIRKWQRAYKSAHEKQVRASGAARDRIVFRSFEVGCLALFLPTRNSVSKPWAAFNIGQPHRFLRAPPPLAEHLRTREWVVARITGITERVASPDENPFQLPDGTRYYLLDVEVWQRSGTGRGGDESRMRRGNASGAAPPGHAASTRRRAELRPPVRMVSDPFLGSGMADGSTADTRAAAGATDQNGTEATQQRTGDEPAPTRQRSSSSASTTSTSTAPGVVGTPGHSPSMVTPAQANARFSSARSTSLTALAQVAAPPRQ